MYRFVIYRDSMREFRWRLSADVDRIIANSAASFVSKEACQVDIRSVMEASPLAVLVDLSEYTP